MNRFRKLKSLIGDEHISGKFNLPWNLDFLPEIGTLILVPVSITIRECLLNPTMFLSAIPPSLPRSFSFPSARLKPTLASRWLESRSFPTSRNLTCYFYPFLFLFLIFRYLNFFPFFRYILLLFEEISKKGNIRNKGKFWWRWNWWTFFFLFIFAFSSSLINLKDREIYGGFI